ncbi:MAG: outer membrane beta-barrel protein [Verrucomicrobia bacterium]|nr:outer membrane beta-barrel protein [Verrucomicrobiota bacterium]
MNKWTVGLAAAGVVSLASTAQAEENSVLTALSSTVISGSVEASYMGSLSGSNQLYSDDGFVANGASLAIGSPLGEGDYSAGYNVELLLGDRADVFSGSSDGLHIKNANIGLNVPFGNGVDLTVGLFDTIVGYEVEASGSNPNVHRSYGYGLEPVTHTGVLASTTLSDNLSVSFGLASAFNAVADANGSINGEGNFAYLVGVDFTVPDSLGFLSGSNLYVGYASGADAGADNDDDNKLLYIGASVSSPIEGVSLGVAYDDLESPNGPDQDAVAIYALWDVSDGVSLATRYDTLDDGSDTKSMWSVTLGYSIWENVLTRLEYNYEMGDREDGDSSGFALNLFYQF